MGLDTKTYWLTDRQLQRAFDFDLAVWVQLWDICQTVMMCVQEAEEPPLLEAVTRKWLLDTQKTGKSLSM
jgi:hypothetical protein